MRELSGGSIQMKVKQAGEETASESKLELPMRRIVNAGSVGEPRHGSTEATYVIHHDDSDDIEIREVAYDIERTCRALLMPGSLRCRLVLSHGFGTPSEPTTPPTCER